MSDPAGATARHIGQQVTEPIPGLHWTAQDWDDHELVAELADLARLVDPPPNIDMARLIAGTS